MTNIPESINSPEDARQFIEYLIENDLTYHLDDDPADILWSKPIPPETLDFICQAHADMWQYFTGANLSPWDLFDDRNLWDRYGGSLDG